jgi:hypothetical protein
VDRAASVDIGGPQSSRVLQANGVATQDHAIQDKVVEDLTGYTEDFGAFLHSPNPSLPKEAVAELVQEHVLTLKDVVDAQAAGTSTRPLRPSDMPFATWR